MTQDQRRFNISEAQTVVDTTKETQSWSCQVCGKVSTRIRGRGQVPKNCSYACRQAHSKRKVITCKHCGKTTRSWGANYCSVTCSGLAKAVTQKKCPTCLADVLDRKKKYCSPSCRPSPSLSPLREAYAAQDWARVILALKENTISNDLGCWIWQGYLIKGKYGCIQIGSEYKSTHRLMMEATHEASLGDQPIHHKCAETSCINPDHLQPVTHYDNLAEMLARKTYLFRIEELEKAIREINPTHEVLNRVTIN